MSVGDLHLYLHGQVKTSDPGQLAATSARDELLLKSDEFIPKPNVNFRSRFRMDVSPILAPRGGGSCGGLV